MYDATLGRSRFWLQPEKAGEAAALKMLLQSFQAAPCLDASIHIYTTSIHTTVAFFTFFSI